jgi:glycosyltransferase involved in cell wall biosynthesis
MSDSGSTADARRTLLILGVRGIPAAHGGFETFAAEFAPYLVARGWKVAVYCQIEPGDPEFVADGVIDEAEWRGVRRIRVHTARPGAAGTVVFDWRCLAHAAREPGVLLVLGYNTALFTLRPRLAGRRIAMNMDGIEWRRGKWPLPHKIWFYVNEVFGANVAQTVIADHPEIRRHVQARAPFADVTVIPYGAHAVTEADPAPLAALGLEPDRYFVSIARIEPENSIHLLVEGFTARPRAAKLAILGRFEPDASPYHAELRRKANADVLFLGAIYDPAVVAALRFHARGYLHGHTVGGTNPSLVEALGAGSPVIAHRNRFNAYVCGSDQRFFETAAECDAAMTELLASDAAADAARAAARRRHAEEYRWETVLAEYEALMEKAAGL